MKQNIILIALAIIGGILIYGLFNKKPDSNYLELIKAKDETIKSIASERDVYRQWKDEAISELHKKDSALQLKYKSNIKVYEKIPVTVTNYSDDELRSAVESFR